MDMTAEEKRQKHQQELRERLKEEALQRIKGMKTGTEDKKYIVIYLNIGMVENKLLGCANHFQYHIFGIFHLCPICSI